MQGELKQETEILDASSILLNLNSLLEYPHLKYESLEGLNLSLESR